MIPNAENRPCFAERAPCGDVMLAPRRSTSGDPRPNKDILRFPQLCLDPTIIWEGKEKGIGEFASSFRTVIPLTSSLKPLPDSSESHPCCQLYVLPARRPHCGKKKGMPYGAVRGACTGSPTQCKQARRERCGPFPVLHQPSRETHTPRKGREGQLRQHPTITPTASSPAGAANKPHTAV
ncbi:hypothetical protein MHYP_G00206380 [Metynnis hypsauchen]